MDDRGGDGGAASAAPPMVAVACCICGCPISPNPTGMCMQCIATRCDVTEGIATRLTMHQCRGCMRWLRPPWVSAELESKELMAICLRKVSGLKKGQVKLVDASWIWTEPHSKRLKLKLTVQKEVVNGAILQQAFVVEFVVRNQQCTECAAAFADQTWKSVVQVRQRVDHKRTFFYLEQLILKHNAHANCINVQMHKDGMDFFFKERNQGARFIDFLENVIPVKVKHSKKLVSADNHSNVANFHHTNLVTIVPICKDDLVLLPAKLAAGEGQMSRLCLVHRITSSINLIDPMTAQTAEVSTDKYNKYPFPQLLSSSRLVPFVVLGCEGLPEPKRVRLTAPHAKRRKASRSNRLSEVELARESDLGSNDTRYTTTTHLGHLLRAGDTVLGYDLVNANVDVDDSSMVLPDVVLVRKKYEKKGSRQWRLQELEKDNMEEDPQQDGRDYERFMQQLEADKDMRSRINLYKEEEALPSEDGDELDEEALRMEELLDGMRLGAGPEEAPEPVVFAAGQAPITSFLPLEDLSDDDDL